MSHVQKARARKKGRKRSTTSDSMQTLAGTGGGKEGVGKKVAFSNIDFTERVKKVRFRLHDLAIEARRSHGVISRNLGHPCKCERSGRINTKCGNREKQLTRKLATSTPEGLETPEKCFVMSVYCVQYIPL